MLWLTGHWEWHALCCYVLVPLDGEPTLIYSMGGTHAEAVRRESSAALADVRDSRGGKYAEVMVERLKELKLERGRIGLLEIDPRHATTCRSISTTRCARGCPTPSWCSPRAACTSFCRSTAPKSSTACARPASFATTPWRRWSTRAGRACTEYELRAAAGAAILEGGGDIDFLIIGSTPMANPAHGVRQSAPVRPRAQARRHHQHGARRRLSRLHRADRFADLRRRRRPRWCASSGTRSRCPAIRRSSPRSRPASRSKRSATPAKFFRAEGRAVAPDPCHGIDLVTDGPHVFCEQSTAEPFEQVLQARHGDHGRAQPDHRRRHVRHLPRPHLHRHRDRPRGSSITGRSSWWRSSLQPSCRARRARLSERAAAFCCDWPAAPRFIGDAGCARDRPCPRPFQPVNDQDAEPRSATAPGLRAPPPTVPAVCRRDFRPSCRVRSGRRRDISAGAATARR